MSLISAIGFQGWGHGTMPPPLKLQGKKMQKNGSNRLLMKHNHDWRYICCPLKNALPRGLVKKKTLTLTLTKNYKKFKKTVFLLTLSAF